MTPSVSRRWLLVPLLVGSALRLWSLQDQPLLDDELAAVRAALALPPLELLFSYGKQDYFQLTAALARFLLDRGVPLSEWIFRAPTVAVGIAALWILPVLAARVSSAGAARIFAALVAVSPVLVIYSRLARAYLPMALCAAAACFDLCDGVRTGSRRSFLRAGALGAFAAWFHLTSVPFLAGAFLASACWLARDLSPPGRRAQVRFSAGVALGVVIGGVLILPAVSSLSDQLVNKTGAASISAATWRAALHYLAGFAALPVVLLAVGLAITGVVAIGRASASTASILAAAVAAQFVGIALLSPFGSNFELVLTRYLMVCLPTLLLFAAAGLDALGRGVSHRWQAAIAPSGAAVALALGPLFGIYAGRSSLAHHTQRLRYLHAEEAAATPLPAVLAQPVLREARAIGWVVPRLASGSFRSLERIDLALRKRIVLVELDRRAPKGALAFRNAFGPDPDALRRAGIDAVGVTRTDFPYIPERRKRSVASPQVRAELRREAFEQMLAQFGEPAFVDSTHAVWDLSRLVPVGEGGAAHGRLPRATEAENVEEDEDPGLP